MPYETLLLTPKVARELLAHSGQRFVEHQRLITLLAVFDGLTDTTLSLDKEGRLVNGHHRCALVALTGRSLRVRVAYGAYMIEWDDDLCIR